MTHTASTAAKASNTHFSYPFLRFFDAPKLLQLARIQEEVPDACMK
jgi:hypothetical protein